MWDECAFLYLSRFLLFLIMLVYTHKHRLRASCHIESPKVWW